MKGREEREVLWEYNRTTENVLYIDQYICMCVSVYIYESTYGWMKATEYIRVCEHIQIYPYECVHMHECM